MVSRADLKKYFLSVSGFDPLLRLISYEGMILMAKVNNNAMMSTISGLIGNTLVFRQWRGRTLVSNRPRGDRKFNAQQILNQEKFAAAVSYAGCSLKDPEMKAMYETGVTPSR